MPSRAQKMKRAVLRQTYSVCPVCHARIPAQQVLHGEQVRLEKRCEEHGFFSTLIWRGKRDIAAWRGDVPAIAPGENANCPSACGLCAEHRRDTCCVLLEITSRCNLNCKFCFADAADAMAAQPPLGTVVRWLRELAKPGEALVQLSGGEPTMRDDLPAIIVAAKQAGCAYVQLNSNGIRLAQEPDYAKKLADAGLSFVFMQFDGVSDAVYRQLRGKPLLRLKEAAIENCAKQRIGVTLVPTLVPQVNTHQIGDIIRFAAARSPAVRGVHFQPVSYFGRIPTPPEDGNRFLLDELLCELQAQCGDLLDIAAIRPSRCDHPLCGFHGDFVVLSDGRLHPISNGKNAPPGAQSTAEKNRRFVARRWQRPAADSENASEEDCHCSSGHRCYPEDHTKNGPLRAPPRDRQDPLGEIATLDGFLRRVKTNGFTVTAMAFQDAWNLDIERLRQCSLHVYHDGRHVPFCAYYLQS